VAVRRLALTCCLLLAGCGSTLATSAKRPVHATLMLDFVPNRCTPGSTARWPPAITGARHRPERDPARVDLGPARADRHGRIEFALADGIDVAEQAAQGHDAWRSWRSCRTRSGADRAAQRAPALAG